MLFLDGVTLNLGLQRDPDFQSEHRAIGSLTTSHVLVERVAINVSSWDIKLALECLILSGSVCQKWTALKSPLRACPSL